jgi:hypothetical protein
MSRLPQVMTQMELLRCAGEVVSHAGRYYELHSGTRSDIFPDLFEVKWRQDRRFYTHVSIYDPVTKEELERFRIRRDPICVRQLQMT